MAEFVVKLADERGHTHQQIEQGYSVAEVRDRFASQGYLVHWVKPQGLLSNGFSFRRGRKLKHSSFLVFNQQFLTLIKAGLPILNSLDLLIKRQRDATLRQVLENVRERVKGGELLSDAFATHAIVPKIYDASLADEALGISTEDAYAMAKRLAREEGLLVGISAAAAVVGCLQLARQLEKNKDAVFVTIFYDSGDKYLSERFWQEE